MHLNDWVTKLIAELLHFNGNVWMFGGKIPGKPVCSVAKAFKHIIRRADIYDDEVCIHTCHYSAAALVASRGDTLYNV